MIRSRLAAGLLALGAVAAHAEVTSIELVGFGLEGPSRAYARERFAPLRFRLSGAPGQGAPVTVVLRRDDGATTIVPAATGGVVEVSDVPLKSGRFSLNEYRAFALLPDGAILEGPRPLSIVRVDVDGPAARVADDLEARRSRLGAEGAVRAAPPPVHESTTGLAALPLDPGFEAEPGSDWF
jgi:hypothetical protein